MKLLKLLPLILACGLPALGQTATIDITGVCPVSYDSCNIGIDEPPYPHAWDSFNFTSHIGFVNLYLQEDSEGVTHTGQTAAIKFLVSAPNQVVAGSVVTVMASFSFTDTETGLTYPSSTFAGTYQAHAKGGRYGGFTWTILSETITLQ